MKRHVSPLSFFTFPVLAWAACSLSVFLVACGKDAQQGAQEEAKRDAQSAPAPRTEGDSQARLLESSKALEMKETLAEIGPSFRDADFDKRCSSLRSFIADYAGRYLESRIIHTFECKVAPGIGQGEMYHLVNLTLRKNSELKSLNFYVFTSEYYDRNFVASCPDLKGWEPGSCKPTLEMTKEQAFFGIKIENFFPTLQNYIGALQTKQGAFGFSYPQFIVKTLNLFSRRQGLEGVRLVSTPDNANPAKGMVTEFVPEKRYFPVLGCENEQCLKKGSITFEFKGARLFLYRQDTTGKEFSMSFGFAKVDFE